ncbi:MAG: hypothetical protein KGL90_06900 [Burkholderiales bacterium]|nr:hypothetical protein [Burkholderiales bacterium]
MLITLLVWSAMVASACVYVEAHWQAMVPLRGQSIQVRLPSGLRAQADVRTPLQTRIDTRSTIAVPIHQTVGVELIKPVSATAVIHTVLPVDTSVSVDQEVPVVTEVEVQVPLVSWLPRMKVVLPVKFSVPVRFSVPVHLQVPLDLDVHVAGRLAGPLQIPIHTVMHATVPLHTDVQAEVLNQADFTLLGLQDPFRLTIHEALLRMPLRDIAWCHNITCVPSSMTWLAGKR